MSSLFQNIASFAAPAFGKMSHAVETAMLVATPASTPASTLLQTPYVLKKSPSAGSLLLSGGLGHLFSDAVVVSGRSPFAQHIGHGVRPFAKDFYTQAGAADYIAGQMVTSYNGPAVDKIVRDAVREACLEWQPGQDLAKLVHDKVLAALQGVQLSGSPKASGGFPGLPNFEFPDLPGVPEGLPTPQNPFNGPPQFGHADTAEAVAELMAAQIRANGSTVGDVAEHLLQTPIDAPR